MSASDERHSLEEKEPRGVATHVRASLLLSSVQALRGAGLYDPYIAALSPSAQKAIFSFPASHWHPMQIANDHYLACESLNLTVMQQVDLGHQVSDRVQGTFLGLILRTARRMGVSPWSVLNNVDRIWNRVLKGGGGVQVTKVSDQAAHCKLAGLPVIDIPYLRNAWRGAFLAAIEPFCRHVTVTEITDARRLGVVVYGLSWS